MGYYQKLIQLQEIYDHLEDRTSKTIFENRIDYCITKDKTAFVDSMYKLDRQYRCTEVEKRLKEIDVDGIIIYGSGNDGKKTLQLLMDCGYSVNYFCESNKNKEGLIVNGLKVLSVDTVEKEYRNYLIILGSRIYVDEMHEILRQKHFPEKFILHPELGILVGECGWQYFDVFKPLKNEVFIDAGCWDGETINEFMKFSQQNYEKVIAFEPLEEMCTKIQNRIRNEKWKNIELINAATWNCKDKLSFAENTTGSRIDKNGKRTVRTIDIDSIVKKDRVTYIKMDVEGAELKALEGAAKTILKNQPRLAISLYHNTWDVIDIPYYILTLVPNYKFYIRHYTSEHWETVLYAYV